jgi:transcriptional regulator with XRE-family HTH domain
MSLGEQIKKARQEKGITQRQLAEMIGAKHTSISGWEHGDHKPDADTIELICGALDVSPGYLLGTADYTITGREELLIECFRDSDHHTQEVVKRLLGYYERLNDKE